VFTGIVQQQGILESRESVDGDARLAVETPWDLAEHVGVGDSVAVNGVCLTVAERRGSRLLFDASAETLSKTRLGEIRTGERLNLEPALSASDPVGGHFVTGHVDGIGAVTEVTPDGRSHRVRIEAPESLTRYIAPRGCISVDGVSLTVTDIDGARFGFNVVPHTWSVTNMQHYTAGSRVHLEVDLIARYLERLMSGREATPEEPDITTDFLSRQGFAPPLSDAEQEEYEDWQDARSDDSD